MTEAVIVATARSPIGRAFKGSLRDIRPDDLTVRMVRAALAQVPQLDAEDINDLMLGCGQQSGVSGFNMARIVAVLAGLDQVPGTTVNRFCSSSLQTTRMALHAIRAGEGDVFISAGVETVSRYGGPEYSDLRPDALNPAFADARARTDAIASGGRTWTDPRDEGALPDVYVAMGHTAENVAALHGIGREEQDAFAVRSQNRTEKAIADGFWAKDITPVTLPDGTVVSRDDGPRAGVTLEAVGEYAAPYLPGLLWQGSNEEPVGPSYAHVVAPRYFNTRKTTIYGGSNEIQKGIISKMVLGL